LDDFKLAGLPDIQPEDIIGQEIIEPPPVTNDRTLARRIALQILYEIDSVHHPLHQVMATQLDFHQPARKTGNYAHHLVEGVIQGGNLERIDRVITHFAPEFPLNQVALVDRNILRIAVFEMSLDNQRVPLGAVITEAVELGKLYGSESTSRFVNGVLGALASDLDTVHELLYAGDQPGGSESEAS
jgi:N utilization substance protein B